MEFKLAKQISFVKLMRNIRIFKMQFKMALNCKTVTQTFCSMKKIRHICIEFRKKQWNNNKFPLIF